MGKVGKRTQHPILEHGQVTLIGCLAVKGKQDPRHQDLDETRLIISATVITFVEHLNVECFTDRMLIDLS